MSLVQREQGIAQENRLRHVSKKEVVKAPAGAWCSAEVEIHQVQVWLKPDQKFGVPIDYYTSMSVLLPELVHLLWCTRSDVCYPSKVRFSIVVLGLRAKVRYSGVGSSAVESRWFRTLMVVPFRFGFRHFRSNAHK